MPSEGDPRGRNVLRHRRPATLLFTGAVLGDVLTHATPQFLENEFVQDDSVKFAGLTRARSPVDSLGMATRDEPLSSSRGTGRGIERG